MLAPSGRRASSRCIPGHRTQGSPGQERQYRSSNLPHGADIVTDQDKYGKAEKNDNGRLTSEVTLVPITTSMRPNGENRLATRQPTTTPTTASSSRNGSRTRASPSRNCTAP